MKNLFKSNLCRFGIGILALAYACTNPEEVMYTYTDQNAFETQDNAIEAVNGIYAPFHSVSLATIYLNDLSTDACFKSENDFEILNDGKMSENSDVANAWNGYYQMISRANLVIDHLPDIDSEAFLDSKPSKERLLAEAYFLRAFAYYNLTDFFYKVPLVTDSEIKVTAKEPLAGIDAIEEQIIRDLTLSLEGLPESYGSTVDAGRAPIGAAYAMLCRVKMRAAGRTRLAGGNAQTLWNEALTYVDKVLELETKGVHSLQQDIWNVFDPSKDATLYNNELIFAVRSRKDVPTGSTDLGMYFTPWNYDMGWDIFNVPLELTWQYDPADDRYTKLLVTEFDNVYGDQIHYEIPASVEQVGLVYGENKPQEGWRTEELSASYTQKYKYLNPGTYNYNTNNNMVHIRLADMILCKAEILNELNGPTQEAVDLVNRIRERAFHNSDHNLKLADYASTAELRSAICDERLLELTHEGRRRPDLIRMGLWKDRMDTYIARIKEKSEWSEKNSSDPNADYSTMWKVYPQNLTENDARRYYPIPKRETDINPALKENRVFN